MNFNNVKGSTMDNHGIIVACNRLDTCVRTLKEELGKEKPSRRKIEEAISYMPDDIAWIRKEAELDPDVLQFADEDDDIPVRQNYPEEVNGLLTKYGVATFLGISVKTVENRMRDARRGMTNFPNPHSSIQGNGGKPAHLWSKESIGKYKNQKTRSFGARQSKARKRIPVHRYKDLLTKYGVAEMLERDVKTVKKLLARAKAETSLFPLPVDRKVVGNGTLPCDLWKEEDIREFLQVKEIY